MLKASNNVVEALSSINGTTEIESSVDLDNPELQVVFDRDKLGFYGLTIAEVSRDIRYAFEGNADNKFRVDDREYDINIKYDGFNRKSKADLESLEFKTQKGIVSLSQFAEIEINNGSTVLERYNRSSSASVSCQLVGISQGLFSNNLNSLCRTISPKV